MTLKKMNFKRCKHIIDNFPQECLSSIDTKFIPPGWSDIRATTKIVFYSVYNLILSCLSHFTMGLSGLSIQCHQLLPSPRTQTSSRKLILRCDWTCPIHHDLSFSLMNAKLERLTFWKTCQQLDLM